MPSDLPAGCETQTVVIDGERYVRLRTVLALFDHTERGMRFRVKDYPLGRLRRWQLGGLLEEGAGDWLQKVLGDPRAE